MPRLAEQFEVHKDALYRHYDLHVTDSAKRAAKIGPFATEEQIRRLCAENDHSVLENLLAIYQGLARLYLEAIEAKAVDRATTISRVMHENLKLRARISNEIAPPSGPTIFNTIIQAGNFRSEMLELAKEVPEAKPRLLKIVKMMADEEAKLLNVTPGLEAEHAA